MKIFKNLFGNGSKIHASEIITGTQDNYKTVEEFMNIPPLTLKRADTLTGRMQITSTNYASPNVVPLKEPYGENLYLICLEIVDRRNAPCVMWIGNSSSNSAGQILVGANAAQPVMVSIIRSGNNVGFYGVEGTTLAVYVTAIYKLD